MVRWLRWHCPPDTRFEIRALAVWGRARYLSVTEAPHNTYFHTWMGKKQFCFFQTAETGNRTPDSGVKGSGANHYPRAPAPLAETAYSFILPGNGLVIWQFARYQAYLGQTEKISLFPISWCENFHAVGQKKFSFRISKIPWGKFFFRFQKIPCGSAAKVFFIFVLI